MRLKFNGTCAKAIELYEKAFNAKAENVIHFSEASENDYSYLGDKNNIKDMIFNANIKIDTKNITLSDDINNLNPTAPKASPNLSVHFKTEGDLKACYEIMCDGAEITRHLSLNSRSRATACLKDKFGISWEFMVC